MTRFRVSVHITPRRGILDPQGKTVANALHSLGFIQVQDVRIGRHVVIDLDALDVAAAEHGVCEMCERLLANPVTEDYEIASIV